MFPLVLESVSVLLRQQFGQSCVTEMLASCVPKNNFKQDTIRQEIQLVTKFEFNYLRFFTESIEFYKESLVSSCVRYSRALGGRC